MERQTSLETGQAWNGLYLAADNDTAFRHVTDRSEASTILSRYSTSVDTTNTEPCYSVSTIWYCSSSQTDIWPITLTGWIPQLAACRLVAAELFTWTTLAMLRSTEWLVIVFIGCDFQKDKQLRHNVMYRIMYFRNLKPCSLANRYQHFRGTCCLHFLSWRWWNQVAPSPNMLALLYQTVRHHLPGSCKLRFAQHKWHIIKPAYVQLGTHMLQHTDLQLILYWFGW